MRALTEDAVRGSFVNATEAELDRLELPWWFGATLWDSLDYLGWTDPALPERGYLVTHTSFGLVGAILRLPKTRPQGRRTLCNFCWTQHAGGGALLMVARRAGRAGLNHNTVGTYVCADLACAVRARSEIPPWLRERDPEEVAAERTAELEQRVHGFLDAVLR